MFRAVMVSVIALGMLWVVAQSMGKTPAQREADLLRAEINREDGLAYLERKRHADGVHVFPDGLLVRVEHAGDGASPEPEQWVRVHYRGAHLDGRVFDSSWRRQQPVTLRVDKTIEAWQRVLPGMREGGRVWLLAPPRLAYGTQGSGPIGPEESLVFEIHLLEVLEEPTVAATTSSALAAQ